MVEFLELHCVFIDVNMNHKHKIMNDYFEK